MSARRRFGLLALLCSSACSRTYDTVATYEAPRGGYRAKVTSAATFSGDDDLNPRPVGAAKLTPLPGHTGALIELDRPVGTVMNYQLDGVAQPPLSWDPGANEKQLRTILTAAGYVDLPADETEEMAGAIDGVMYGPKGTRMPGQAHAIRVVSVVFK